ncbi:hypothetical protein SASPL_118399 [Salvia splendens]|uniref:carotenoid 9,10-dioxygenase n=1 Tax=Salvia splendens TaxID=180675 RepID=A0A8X8XXP0_SALSN|nr:hypothetical protein SASPL_118399 [Salvia splendens]
MEKTRGGAVLVRPEPKTGLISSAIDWLEWAFVKLMHDSNHHSPCLSGNFAPVDETHPLSDLAVKGDLPVSAFDFSFIRPEFRIIEEINWLLQECLNGEIVRVGPNPRFAPVAGYHWFDGDGMVHGVRIKNGKASYVSRFVKTSRLKQEEIYGRAKFVKLGDLRGIFGLIMGTMHMLRTKLKVLDASYGNGTANTALVYHHGKLLVLGEADKPYVMRVLEDGDLQTIGMMDYDKRLSHSFTAHPKVDPLTGEMFTFGYSQTPPYITYRVISKEGVMQEPVPITIPKSIMMHDFAITENYAIFMDLPLYFIPKEMVKENKFIYTYDHTKEARFGILPRYAENEMLIKWFELPNCFIFHTSNAWEEGDEVVLISCRIENADLDVFNGSVKEKFENFKSELYEMRFNLKSGQASQKRLSASAVDFPIVNERYTGRKQRYLYGTILDHYPKVTGIIKFDLQAEPDTKKEKLEVGGNVSGIFDLGPGRFGSEAIFVPQNPDNTCEEDDGYLIFFVHDESSGPLDFPDEGCVAMKSEVNIIDAKTMSADPVAIVELPRRVPYGFHAFFVTEEQLQKQA